MIDSAHFVKDQKRDFMEGNEADPENGKKTELHTFCSECGHEFEPGAEFCYQCGSVRRFSVGDDNKVVVEKGVCPFCGCKNDDGADFCIKCGHRLGEYEYAPTRRTPLGPKDYLIMAVAFIPGAFNIFGLGHILLKKYSRGFMYLVISMVLLYMIYCSPELNRSVYLMLELLGFVIYMKQSFEVLYEIYRGRE